MGSGDLRGCVSATCGNAKYGDVLAVETTPEGQKRHGVVLNVWAGMAWMRMLEDEGPRVSAGMSVVTVAKDERDSIFGVPVGEQLLGRVLDYKFRPLDGKREVQYATTKPLGTWQPEISDRQPIKTALSTGIKIVDALTPLGRGQAMLIHGDKGTGKTTLALDIAVSQKNTGVKCIYVSMSKNQQELEHVVSTLTGTGAMDNTVVLHVPPSAPAMELFAAPLHALTMAEHIRDEGGHALVIYDDLNAHIRLYTRLTSTLDDSARFLEYHVLWRIFYSGIVQRSSNLNEKLGGGTLTSLLLLEEPEFVPNEMMSVSDGQLCLSKQNTAIGLLQHPGQEDSPTLWPCVDIRKYQPSLYPCIMSRPHATNAYVHKTQKPMRATHPAGPCPGSVWRRSRRLCTTCVRASEST